MKGNLARGTIGEKQARYLIKYNHETQDRLAKKIIEYEFTKNEAIAFIKSYEENTNVDIDELAKEIKGVKKIEVSLEELSKEARKEIEKLRKEKKE